MHGGISNGAQRLHTKELQAEAKAAAAMSNGWGIKRYKDNQPSEKKIRLP